MGPPVAWEESMEEVSPEEDAQGSDREKEGIPDGSNVRGGRGPTVDPRELCK